MSLDTESGLESSLESSAASIEGLVRVFRMVSATLADELEQNRGDAVALVRLSNDLLEVVIQHCEIVKVVIGESDLPGEQTDTEDTMH